MTERLSQNITNNFTTDSNLDEDLLKINVIYTACECLVALGAVIGNGLVLIAFKNERRLRRRTNYYIVSLAAADLLVGSLGIPFAILASVGLPTQLHACLFTVSLLVMLCTISIFSLVAVSVDRYWAIIYPMGYSRNVRTRTAIAIIAVCWVAGSLVGLLPLLGWNKAGPDFRCRFVEVMDYNYLVFLYFATIIFPALLLLASYSHIFLVVRRQIRQMASLHPTPSTKLRVLGAAQRREVKAAQNLAIIVLFFIICWIPLYTINCVKAFCPSYEPPLPLTNFCIILSHLNSAVNPLLYAYHLRDFRAALKNLLCPCYHFEANDSTIYGRHSIACTNRVHQVNIVTRTGVVIDQEERQSWLPTAPQLINGNINLIRRKSLSLGSLRDTKETIPRIEAVSISKIICQRESHSESNVVIPHVSNPIKIKSRSHSVETANPGLINSGFVDDGCLEPLVFSSLPPIETNLALQVLTRSSSATSTASNDALVLKDNTLVQFTRCSDTTKSENEGRS